MNITVTQLYAMLSEKLDKDTAEALTSYIETKVEKQVKMQAEHLATKTDLSDGLATVKVDLIKWMVSLVFGLACLIIGLYFRA